MLQHEAEYIDARPLTTDSSNLLATHGRTIHLGQKRTFECARAMSALPPKADIVECDRHVRFVPKADKVQRSKRTRQCPSHSSSDLRPRRTRVPCRPRARCCGAQVRDAP